MTASNPLGNLRRDLLPTILAFILALSCSAVHATTPGEEHTHAVFQDDFEDWDEDAWEMLVAPDASYGTSWKILDDDENKVLSLKGTVSALAGEPYWTDYTLMVRVKLVDVPEGAFILVRMGEEGKKYVVEIPQQDPTFIKQLGGESYYLAKVPLAISNGTWHTVKVVCMGGEFWVYIDDELRIECKDEDNPILSGRIGFGCGSHSNFYLDDVWVAVTHIDYVRYLIEEAEEAIDEARMVGADVDEPEGMLKEARAKLAEGDLAAAEGLSKGAAEKAIGLKAEKVSGGQEPPPDVQQPSSTQPGPALSIERVATLITIGGATVGAVGWMFRTRGNRRKRAILFRELTQGVDNAYNRLRKNADQCEAELYRLKDRAIVEFKQGLITEKNYRALDERIEEYLGRLRDEAGE
jgi:hypothetical protein